MMVKSRVRAMIGIVGVVVALSGCWPSQGAGVGRMRWNPLETRIDSGTVATLTPQWSVAAEPGAFGDPVVTGTNVVLAYNRPTGPVYYPCGRLFTCPYYGAEVGATAYDVRSGAGAWSYQGGSWLPPNMGSTNFSIPASMSPAEFVDSEVHLAWNTSSSVDGSVACYDRTVRLDPASGTVVSSSDGVFEGSPVVVGPLTARYTRWCDPSGMGPLLRASTSDDPWLWTAPPVDDTLVYAHDRVIDGPRVYLPGGCGATFPDPCPPVADLSVAGTDVTTAEGPDGTLLVLRDPTSGTAASLTGWDVAGQADVYGAPFDAADAEMATDGERAFVTTSGSGGDAGKLLVFDARGCGAPACAPLWSASLGTTAAAPIVAGGVAYVAATGGVVQAYDVDGCGAATCSPLVSLPVTGEVESMSVANGRLFVLTDTHLTAFAPA